MIDILSQDELRTITGRHWLKHQIRWLQEHDWPYELNDHGYPVVLESVARQKLGINTRKPKKKAWVMDISKVK